MQILETSSDLIGMNDFHQTWELPGKRQAKVLVVDDNPSNRRLLTSYLSTTPYQVITAGNGYEALEMVMTHHPDIILLDIMMPDISGFEVCEKLKSDPENRDIPVIFFSAQAETDDKSRGFSLGAVDYVSKPIKKSEIIARLHAHLTIRFQQLELERKNEELHQLTEALQQANARLEHMARYDVLTELSNRRHFFEQASHYWENATAGTPVSVIMIDIDFFKQYNDGYGHQAGDTCLTQVAASMRDFFNAPGELPARYGGEEFVVMLPATEAETALKKGCAFCNRIQALNIPNKSNYTTGRITISGGVCTAQLDGKLIVEDLIAKADTALYQAKQQGRNQVLPYSEDMHMDKRS